jgi:hypothetical protein
MARVEKIPHHHRGRKGSLKFNLVNQLTTGRNRDAPLGPTPSGSGLLATRGARLAGAVRFDPAPGGALLRAYTGHTKSKRPRGVARGGAMGPYGRRHETTREIRCARATPRAPQRTAALRAPLKQQIKQTARGANRDVRARAHFFCLRRYFLPLTAGHFGPRKHAVKGKKQISRLRRLHPCSARFPPQGHKSVPKTARSQPPPLSATSVRLV